MTLEHQNKRNSSKSMIANAAERVDEALRNTVQSYLTKGAIELDLKQVDKSIRDKPLPYVAIAVTIGFIVGGGMITRPGLLVLGFFGRKVATETAINLMSDMLQM